MAENINNLIELDLPADAAFRLFLRQAKVDNTQEVMDVWAALMADAFMTADDYYEDEDAS